MLASLQLMRTELLSLSVERHPAWSDEVDSSHYSLDFAVGFNRALVANDELMFLTCQQHFVLKSAHPRRKKSVTKFEKIAYVLNGQLILPISLAADIVDEWGFALASNCQSMIFGVARGILLQTTTLTGRNGFMVPSLDMNEMVRRAFEGLDDEFFCEWLRTGKGNDTLGQPRGVTYDLKAQTAAP